MRTRRAHRGSGPREGREAGWGGPARHTNGEGRRRPGKRARCAPGGPTGVVVAARAGRTEAQQGKSAAVPGDGTHGTTAGPRGSGPAAADGGGGRSTGGAGQRRRGGGGPTCGGGGKGGGPRG